LTYDRHDEQAEHPGCYSERLSTDGDAVSGLESAPDHADPALPEVQRADAASDRQAEGHGELLPVCSLRTRMDNRPRDWPDSPAHYAAAETSTVAAEGGWHADQGGGLRRNARTRLARSDEHRTPVVNQLSFEANVRFWAALTAFSLSVRRKSESVKNHSPLGGTFAPGFGSGWFGG